MLSAHQNIIISNFSVLVNETDLNKLVPELLNRNVFNERMINRILNPLHTAERQKTDLYVELLKRGPQAFTNLQEALASSNHLNLAKILRETNPRYPATGLRLSSSLNSVGSNRSLCSSESESESDGPVLSSCRRSQNQIEEAKSLQGTSRIPMNHFPPANGRQDFEKMKAVDLRDFHPSGSKQNSKVFSLPEYEKHFLRNNLEGLISSADKINYSIEAGKPVRVVYATQWQNQEKGKPGLYKMNSNPRGCALIVNNEVFWNEEDYPTREGSKNDVERLTSLLKQFHYDVQVEQNKTKKEMEQITKAFSQKEELNNVDSIVVAFMSHGKEGDHDEDSEIIGVDGLGFKTDTIVGLFYNDSAPALIGKAKVFLFQACRGELLDTGVLIGYLHLGNRIQTDGARAGKSEKQPVKVRTHSDIFVAYSVAPGRQSNRDKFTGTWFIQFIVDVFSQHAWNTHLEDMIKMVDEKIKTVNNMTMTNFQAVSTKTFGWSKNLYFNPGLYLDETTNETVYLWKQKQEVEDEGMDVVDTATSSNNFYSKFTNGKDRHEDDSDDGGGGCFNVSACRTS